MESMKKRYLTYLVYAIPIGIAASIIKDQTIAFSILYIGIEVLCFKYFSTSTAIITGFVILIVFFSYVN